MRLHKHGLEYVPEAARHADTKPHTSKPLRTKEPRRDQLSPDCPLRSRSFGRKSSFRAAQRCSVRTRTTTTGHDSFVLKTSQRTVRTSTSQRSHLLSCEHSWAEQTTGPRTMRLRERMHTNEKKPLKSRQQGRSAQTRKNLTSPAPAMFRNNVTTRLTGFTRFHTCTASNPESDKLTKAKTHKYGSSNHYRC